MLGILKNEKLLVDVLLKNRNDFYKNIDFIYLDLIVEWVIKAAVLIILGIVYYSKMVRT